MTEWPSGVRFAISVAWIGTVIGTIVLSGRRDSSLDKVMATADKVMTQRFGNVSNCGFERRSAHRH
jgi:hypothetical protein